MIRVSFPLEDEENPPRTRWNGENQSPSLGGVPVEHLIDGLLGPRHGETRLDHPSVILEHSSPFWRGHHHATIVGASAGRVNEHLASWPPRFSAAPARM
jgi:hypothetical protein